MLLCWALHKKRLHQEEERYCTAALPSLSSFSCSLPAPQRDFPLLCTDVGKGLHSTNEGASPEEGSPGQTKGALLSLENVHPSLSGARAFQEGRPREVGAGSSRAGKICDSLRV